MRTTMNLSEAMDTLAGWTRLFRPELLKPHRAATKTGRRFKSGKPTHFQEGNSERLRGQSAARCLMRAISAESTTQAT
jgi:hypothetical protein